MTEPADPDFSTPLPESEAAEEDFDFAKIIRSAGEPVSVGVYNAPHDIFEQLTRAVTVPTLFPEQPPERTPIDLSAYPTDKPRYDNIRARLFKP